MSFWYGACDLSGWVPPFCLDPLGQIPPPAGVVTITCQDPGMVVMTQQDRSYHLLVWCPSSIRMVAMTPWDGGHDPLG